MRKFTSFLQQLIREKVKIWLINFGFKTIHNWEVDSDSVKRLLNRYPRLAAGGWRLAIGGWRLATAISAIFILSH